MHIEHIDGSNHRNRPAERRAPLSILRVVGGWLAILAIFGAIAAAKYYVDERQLSAKPGQSRQASVVLVSVRAAVRSGSPNSSVASGPLINWSIAMDNFG